MEKDNLINLPRDEIAIRKVYQPLVEAGKLRVIFRPGNRVCSVNKEVVRCYNQGEEITIRIIEVLGSDTHRIAPLFSDLVKRRVRIAKIKKIDFGDLKDEHFEGSSLDVQNRDQVVYHLGLIYGRMPEEIVKEGVTWIKLEYLD